ncbi:MAG: BtrH N-terminal domain-containing protein [Chloroflexi bacterium]|nr:BtrH N-terminal domain-containing protein [Chloroflexota bacterium]
MKLISNFTHAPGVHCGSTALGDLARYQGLALSEAMCFGLGSGLGFAYFPNTRSSPSRLFHGRTLTLEQDFCAHLGLDYETGAEKVPAMLWQIARAWVDADTPVLLAVELNQLPYYQTRTSFPGHRVVLAGYDDARATAFLADTHFPGLQPIAYDALLAALDIRAGTFPARDTWLAIRPVRPRVPLVDATRAALRDNARAMNLDRAPHLAIMGMETLAEDFENWADAPDWEWCARFGYQIIEKRGTGGGAFRKLYAAYLREAEARDDALRAARLAETMAELADEWTAFAAVLKRVSEEKERALFADASRAIRRLALREEHFWGRVMDLTA